MDTCFAHVSHKWGFTSPLRHRPLPHGGRPIFLDVHRLRPRLVSQPEAELAVHLGFVGEVGPAQQGDHVCDSADQLADLRRGQLPGRNRLGRNFCLGDGAFGLYLGDPAGHHGRVAARFERRAIAVWVPKTPSMGYDLPVLGCR